MDTGIFDVGAIQQSCWQTCEKDRAAFPMDLNYVPVYRDKDTEENFYETATFFGCVEVCEGGYEVKRLSFIIPVVVVGKILDNFPQIS